MIYNVSNKENEIEKLLIELKEIYGDYAFISYLDGEIGMRVRAQWALYTFYNLVKSENIVCIGIVFKNQKVFIEYFCDHIIEIDDVWFDSANNTHVELVGNQTHFVSDNYVPSEIYSGNDGWNLSYIRGHHSNIYESILLKLNYSNIFYTLHLDGSSEINLHGVNTGYLFQLHNTKIHINNVCKNCIRDRKLFINNKIQVKNKTNNIVIWPRNTNKHPNRNMSNDIYNSLFSYCILHNKKCYVFQDLHKISIPDNNNIIELNTVDRFKNIPNFDNFIEICNNSDIFVGVDSGITELAMTCKNDILILSTGQIANEHKNFYQYIDNCEKLINIISSYYSS